jgi:molybdate transport system substrate-binding protein
MGRIACLLVIGLFLSGPAAAAEVSVAVAANFTKAAEEIGAAFAAKTGDTVAFSFGATGALYTQVTQAAPFEVFLSADDKRPAQAVTDGIGVAGTVFTYAVGKLVLYSPTIDVTDGEAVLKSGAFQHIAIADPKTAPYGKAGLEAVERLGLTPAITLKVVTGENITQTLQFIESGNAELGFVARSQVVGKPASQVWMVPAGDYAPILQDAVLLRAGEADPAAMAFMAFLKGPEATAIIEKYGYEVADQ